jgi:hypothetical protein
VNPNLLGLADSDFQLRLLARGRALVDRLAYRSTARPELPGLCSGVFDAKLKSWAERLVGDERVVMSVHLLIHGEVEMKIEPIGNENEEGY